MPVWFSLWFTVSASSSPLSATHFLGWVTESSRKGRLSLPGSIQSLSLCLPCPPQAVGTWEADAYHARAPTPVGLGDSSAASHAERASTVQVSRHLCDATQRPGRALGCPPLSMTHTDHPKDVGERPKPLSFAQSCGQDSTPGGQAMGPLDLPCWVAPWGPRVLPGCSQQGSGYPPPTSALYCHQLTCAFESTEPSLHLDLLANRWG